MNTATKITLARIFLIPLVVAAYLISFPYNNIVACVLFVLVTLTDLVDGKVARAKNQVTDLGKFLDPIADKIVVVIMLFLLAGNGTLSYPWDAVICGVIITRELIISGFRMIAVEKRVVIAADVWGKIKTVLFDIGISALILGSTFFITFGKIVMYVGTVISVYSCVNYMVKGKEVFSLSKSGAQPADENPTEAS